MDGFGAHFVRQRGVKSAPEEGTWGHWHGWHLENR